MSTLRCRPLALLMLVFFLAGCTTWQPTTLSPAQVIEDEQPFRIRVTRSTGARLTVEQPLIQNDSIAGLERVCLDLGGDQEPLGCREAVRAILPLGDVTGLEVQRLSTNRTVAVGLLAAVFAGFVWFLGYVQERG